MYRLNRVNDGPLYFRDKREVRKWIKRNPGESAGWTKVLNTRDELQRLADGLAEIASFAEGREVTSSFDNPADARQARETLYPENQ